MKTYNTTNPQNKPIKFCCYNDFKHCVRDMIEKGKLQLYNYNTNYSSYYYHDINIVNDR